MILDMDTTGWGLFILAFMVLIGFPLIVWCLKVFLYICYYIMCKLTGKPTIIYDEKYTELYKESLEWMTKTSRR